MTSHCRGRGNVVAVQGYEDSFDAQVMIDWLVPLSCPYSRRWFISGASSTCQRSSRSHSSCVKPFPCGTVGLYFSRGATRVVPLLIRALVDYVETLHGLSSAGGLHEPIRVVPERARGALDGDIHLQQVPGASRHDVSRASEKESHPSPLVPPHDCSHVLLACLSQQDWAWYFLC